MLDFVKQQNIEPRKVIEAATVSLPCRFDEETLTYLASRGPITKEILAEYVEDNEQEKQFAERFGKLEQKRYRELFDAQLEDLELHEGFSRQCGLRGSKLWPG